MLLNTMMGKGQTGRLKRMFFGVMFISLMLFGMSIFRIKARGAEANDEVTLARSGILQIKVIYTDDDRNPHEIQSGTGFLVNPETILTCRHVVYPTDEVLKKAAKTYKKKVGQLKDRLTYKISILRDMSLDAELTGDSQSMDFAILTIRDELHDRDYLKFRESSSAKQTEAVYALGFPEGEKTAFTGEDVTITNGQINKASNIGGVDYLQTSAAVTSGNDGGPLVDKEGLVIGMIQAVSGEGFDAGYSYALSIDQVTDALDAYGIEYAGGKKGTLLTRTEQEEVAIKEAEAAKKEQEAEEEQKRKDEEEIKKAEESLKEQEVEPVAEPEEETVPEPENSLPIWLPIAIGAAVAIFIVSIILVLVLKKKKKPEPVPAPVIPPAPAPSDQVGKTVAMGRSGGETVVVKSGGSLAGANPFQAGELLRSSNGEQIEMNSGVFIIGKELAKVNYCISDNPSISRTHVRIEARGDSVYVTDLDTTNGTFLNGVRLNPNQEALLRDGDKLVLADEEFTFIRK